MNSEQLLLLVVIATTTTWTPGPNNVMVASSGANFGVRRTLPHIMGISLGFPLMIMAVGLFLGQVFEASVVLRSAIRWFGGALLLWVAWKIATSGGLTATTGRPRPFRFHEAAAFQWVNPKAWIMSIGVTSQFVTSTNAAVTIPIISAVYIGAAFIGTSAWAAVGLAMTRWLTSPGRLVWFNRVMGLLIAASVAVLLLE